MIIQGTNNPIIFNFSASMTTIADIEISLYNEEKELKHWTLGDVEIENEKIYAPLTQEETVLFPAGKCYFEVKWMDAFGRTNFAKQIPNTITLRNDKTIMEGAAE